MKKNKKISEIEFSSEKDEYILKSLSKLRHKKWELYGISRIIHKLNDPDIEFVCQQLVRFSSNDWALVDLYFPQFHLHLEIDEKQHGKTQHEIDDKKRTASIIEATGHSKPDRIKAYIKKNDKYVPRLLSEFDLEIDKFIEKIRKLKEQQILKDHFVPWDLNKQYAPEPHKERGIIDLSIGAAFRTHQIALSCFGYGGKDYRKAAWKVPYLDDTIVWFPKLYANKDWVNSLENNGKAIVEKYIGENDNKKKRLLKTTGKPDTRNTRIVFAHEADALGKTLYRFKGVFQCKGMRKAEELPFLKGVNEKFEGDVMLYELTNKECYLKP